MGAARVGQSRPESRPQRTTRARAAVRPTELRPLYFFFELFFFAVFFAAFFFGFPLPGMVASLVNRNASVTLARVTLSRGLSAASLVT